MKVHVNRFGDIEVSDQRGSLTVLPRLWDYDRLELVNSEVVLRSSVSYDLKLTFHTGWPQHASFGLEQYRAGYGKAA